MGTLIAPVELSVLLDSVSTHDDVVVVDCRFTLGQPEQGRRSYDQGHLPGAFFLDLELDLSGPVTAGLTGRHPLPSLDALATRLGQMGVGAGTHVVAYDEATGAFAARLWWLCRFLGHDDVQVLDGGLARWVAEGNPLARELPSARPKDFSTMFLRADSIVAADEIEALAEREGARLFDARAADRFRGENETIDLVAGHIPGARSLPFLDNLENGRFKSREQLRARYAEALGATATEQAIVYCGSGVTACHAILAAEHAGLGSMRLYPGSFSEWITDPARPVVVGA